MSTRIETGPGWELRCGRWQDVLTDVAQCDAVITDPPYSPRTHNGYMTATDLNGCWSEYKKQNKLRGNNPAHCKNGLKRREEMNYEPLIISDVHGAVSNFRPFWWVVFGDHVSSRWWDDSLSVDHVVFAPVPWIRIGSAPRFFGDGPSNECEWITIARSRQLPKRRFARPGKYEGSIHGDKLVTGGKPLWLMRAVVRDYSEPGDLIVDPYAGGATTLLAAVMEGRRAIGAECDPSTFDKAVKRLRAGITQDMFAAASQRKPKTKPKQLEIK